MVIIDAQIHVWSPDVSTRPWLPGSTPRAQGSACSAEQVLRVMDDAGVDRTVLVPPSWIGDDNTDALDAARRWPDRFAVMGRFDPTARDAEARLQRWREQPGMRGMRFTFHLPPSSGWLADGSLDWFWAAAERVELPLMVSVPGQPGKIAGIAQRHPRLRFILDHMARPRGLKDAAAFADLDDLLALACHSNLDRILSVPGTRHVPAADPRGVRCAADAVGNRLHAAAGAVPRRRPSRPRGDELPQRGRPRVGRRSRLRRMGGLEDLAWPGHVFFIGRPQQTF